MKQDRTQPKPAGGTPVEQPVRPELWAPDWAVKHAMGGERVQTVLYGAPRDMTGLTRLYDGHDVDVAVAAERERWASRVDGLAAQLREVDARYMALLKAVADGVAMQPRTVVLDLGPNEKGNRPA